MPEAVNADVAWAVEDIRRRLPALTRRRRYYDGKHDSLIPDGKTLSLELRDLLKDLSDNLCDDVVDEPVSRLAITNWSCKVPGVGQKAMDLWKANRMPSRARSVHRNSYRAGDGYVMVQKDKRGRVRFHPQQPEQIAVRYSTDDPDAIELEAKCWKDGARYRLNLYYPDDSPGGARLERFATRRVGANGDMPQAPAFAPLRNGDGDGPVDDDPDWKGTGRLPIFHFPADEVGQYGQSVLTDVIPLQDVLNKSVVDLVVAMEDLALPQRYGTGIQAEYNEDGTEKPLRRRSSVGELLRVGGNEARLGQFPGADLSQFLEVQAAHRAEIARKGYLPAYSVQGPDGGESPTGISLLVQEGRQVKRCKATITDAEPEWAEAMSYALGLDGTAVAPDDLDLEWAPVETRDEAGFWEVAASKIDAGVPKRQVLIEGGYDEADVDAWLDEAESQRDAISGGRRSLAGPVLPTAPVVPVGPAGAPAPAQVTA